MIKACLPIQYTDGEFSTKDMEYVFREKVLLILVFSAEKCLIVVLATSEIDFYQ